MRPSSADVIAPNVAEPSVLPGWPKRSWLNTLNASTRSCICCEPATAKFLNSDRSVRLKPGPRTVFLASFPTCPAFAASVSRSKHAVLNH